jgi:hypothetical protein
MYPRNRKPKGQFEELYEKIEAFQGRSGSFDAPLNVARCEVEING